VNVPTYWIRPPQKLPASKGMHRFVWDLRYSFVGGGRRSRRGPTGAWALPGKYTVKLTVNGKSMTQPLEVKMDPRVKTPAAEMERQFRASSRLAAAIGEFSAAIQRSDELRKQIAARSKEAGENAELRKALEELDKKIEAITAAREGGGFGLFGLSVPGSDPVTLRQVSAALSGLLSIVEGADVGPSADATTAIEKWDAASKETLARWNALATRELAHVNPLLQVAHLEVLTLEAPSTTR